MVRVLQATAWFPPHNLGGTEVYVQGLVEALDHIGVRSDVIVPRHPDAPETYRHHGATVWTYPVGEMDGVQELRSGRPHWGFDVFLERLRSFSGQIYHQHAWTRGCGALHLAAAREAGLKTVLTVHVPGITCLSGTMMRFGEEACDGVVRDTVCAACFLRGRGLAPALAAAVALTPQSLSDWAYRNRGSAMTALASRRLAGEKARELHRAAVEADRIVAVCEWLRDALLGNGIPSEKLTLSRQGLAVDFASSLLDAPVDEFAEVDGPLRILFLGRWDPVKGIETIVRAMLELPDDVSATLTVHAIPPASENAAYRDRVMSLAADSPRIKMGEPVPREGIPAVLARHDVLAVPSQWLETGPLVALEAQASGLHVMGSRLGGLVELIEDGESGSLVDPHDVGAWTRTIVSLAELHQGGSLTRKRRTVRTMATVADEMSEIYRSL